MFKNPFMIKWRLFKKKKEFIEVDSIDLSISIGGINSILKYENKKMEIALALSSFYINHQDEYDLGDYISTEYWMSLADEYFYKKGVQVDIFHKIPETFEDVIFKARMLDLDTALNNIDDELKEVVFQKMANTISTLLSEENARDEREMMARRNRRSSERTKYSRSYY